MSGWHLNWESSNRALVCAREVMANRTTGELESQVDAQVCRPGLGLHLGQESLARDADVGIGWLRTLESGRGSTLRTLVRFARARDLTDWFEQSAPAPAASPVALVQAAKLCRAPRRASGPATRIGGSSAAEPRSEPDVMLGPRFAPTASGVFP